MAEQTGFWRNFGKPILIATTVGLASAYIYTKLIEQRVSRAISELPPYTTTGPSVSVVIPALEEEAYLPDLLRSIAHQTYEPIEVIVVDSSPLASTDKTKAICLTFGARYIHEPILNIALARNKGAEAAEGDILVFTDADCAFTQNYIEDIVEALEDGYSLAHGADPCVGEGIFYDISTLIARGWCKPVHWTTGRGIGIWRQVFFEVGGYNPTCDPMQSCREDLELGRKIVDRYGLEGIKLLRHSFLGTSCRREKSFGFLGELWQVRGVR